jgi:hypothetical protein
LTDEQLWDLTAREYQELERHFMDAVRRDQWFHACIQATLHNANFPCQCSACQRRGEQHRNDHHEPWTPNDFMPDAQKKPKAQQSWQEKKAILDAQFASIAAAFQRKKKDNGG